MSTVGRILLVEDDPKDVELTLTALEDYHLANEVIVARDGEEALDVPPSDLDTKLKNAGFWAESASPLSMKRQLAVSCGRLCFADLRTTKRPSGSTDNPRRSLRSIRRMLRQKVTTMPLPLLRYSRATQLLLGLRGQSSVGKPFRNIIQTCTSGGDRSATRA
jgi:hypothetical protein